MISVSMYLAVRAKIVEAFFYAKNETRLEGSNMIKFYGGAL